MLIVERQDRVLEILREQKIAQLEGLAEQLGVSGSTIRRDLEALEQRGLVERTHGGAVYRGRHRHPVEMNERMQEQISAKRAIGRRAAGMVEPHMTLLLDGGSTVYYMAEMIDARPLQIVTNSLTVANLFADDEKVELLLIGGNLYPRTGVMLGPIARRCLTDLHADMLFFSLAGIYDNVGYNQNLAMAEIEQIMIQQAAQSVLMMDSSKFGRKSLSRVCPIDDVDVVVTDEMISDKWRTQFGDRLVVAG